MAAGGMAVDEKQAGIERRLQGAGRGDRRRRRRLRPGPGAGRGRARPQPHREPLRDLRSREPRRALDPDARREPGLERRRRRGQRRQRAAGRRPASRRRLDPSDASNKNEETVNYEISRTTRTEILEGGRVKRLSVAVLVDGVYAEGRRRRDDLPAAPAGGARPHRRAGPHRGRLRQEPRRPARGREPALRRGAGRGAELIEDAAPHLAVQPDQGGPAAADRDSR